MAGETIVCDAACTITVQHEIVTPLLDLSLSDGGQIAAAVVMVWVVGWAVRMAIRAMNVDEARPTSSTD